MTIIDNLKLFDYKEGFNERLFHLIGLSYLKIVK